MNLLLKRFSQDVDLSNPNQVNYFLVLETPQGAEVRLPVQKETTEALVRLVYASTPAAPTKRPVLKEKVSEEELNDLIDEVEKEMKEEVEEDLDEFDETEYIVQKKEALEPENEDAVPSL